MRTMRLAVALPTGDSLGGPGGRYPGLAISPDGKEIAYVATHDGITQLYLRNEAEWYGTPIPGTLDGHTPFFSPDGQWLGAVVGDKVIKIPVAGGAAVTLATVAYHLHGASWASDGWIYLGSENPIGLIKIPVTGGEPLGATSIDDDHGETDIRYPESLPGGKWVLFVGRDAGHTYDEAKIDALSPLTGKRKHLIKGGTSPHYIPGGHLAFVREGKLMVAPFDPVNAEVRGEPVAVMDGIAEDPTEGAAQIAVSAEGSVIYTEGGATFAERELVFIDRTGATRVLSAKKAPYEDVAISPDGRQLAFAAGAKTTDVWLHDMASGAEKQLSTGGEHRSPAWTADGRTLLYTAYTGVMDAGWVIVKKGLDASDSDEHKMMTSEVPVRPWFVSHDGNSLLYEEMGLTGKYAAHYMSMGDSHHVRTLIQRDFNQEWAQLSPDGHWLAYNSDDSGAQEIYLAPFPSMQSTVKVSAGIHPQWSPDGQELYFLTLPTADSPRPPSKRVAVMAATIETTPQLHAGTPHMLFDGPFAESGHDYAVTPDGRGFIFIRESEPAPVGHVNVIVNFTAELAHPHR